MTHFGNFHPCFRRWLHTLATSTFVLDRFRQQLRDITILPEVLPLDTHFVQKSCQRNIYIAMFCQLL